MQCNTRKYNTTENNTTRCVKILYGKIHCTFQDNAMQCNVIYTVPVTVQYKYNTLCDFVFGGFLGINLRY